MFGISGAGYDTSTSIFSPEGRIFAAEYAKQAVEKGATSIGIQAKDGIILLAEKRIKPLQEPDSIEKISKIDTHIAVAASGYMADARQLIQEARVKAQSYTLTFEEAIPAFLSLILIPLTYSITQGIVWGFLSYTIIKVLVGKAKEIPWMLYIIDIFAILSLVIQNA